MIQPLLAVPSLLIVCLICTGFGRQILRFVAPDLRGGLQGSLFGAGIGLGVFGYLVMLLGLLGLLYPAVVLGLLITVALISRRQISDVVSEMAAGFRSRPHLTVSSVLVALPLAAIGGAVLLCTLAPPSVNDWDALAYHLSVPALYIKWHAIRYIPFTSHSNLPFQMEMLYTTGLVLPGVGSAALAKSFHFAVGVFSVLTIYAAGARHFSRVAGVVGALTFASIPLVGWEATAGYIDLGTAFYVALAVLALLNHRDEGGAWGILAAASLGMASATKTTALAFIPMAVVWLIYNDLRRGGRLRDSLFYSVILGLVAAVIASPWYIKSFLCTGNPVYPFLYNVFGGINWNAELAEFYRKSQLGFGMGKDVSAFVLMPWNLTMFPAQYFDVPVLFASIGPVFLVALPMFAAVKFGCGKLRALLAFILASTIVWFLLTQQSRYLIPVMAVGAVAVGGLWDRLGNLRLARATLAITLTAAVSWGLFMNLTLAVFSASGLADPEAYLTRTLDIYPACEYVNNELPPTTRLLLIGETRGFYCHRDYLWGDAMNNTLIPYDQFRDPRDMVRYLRLAGITHVLVNMGNRTVRQAKPPRYIKLFQQATSAGLLTDEFTALTGPARHVTLFRVEPTTNN